jgi:hypothetical protein
MLCPDAVQNERVGLISHAERCVLDGPDHELLHALDEDIATARERTKPLLGIFRRRGQVKFAVIQGDSSCQLAQELDACNCHISAIKLGERPVTIEQLNRAISHIKQLRGIRISKPEGFDLPGEEEYFVFHIDFEAAA